MKSGIQHHCSCNSCGCRCSGGVIRSWKHHVTVVVTAIWCSWSLRMTSNGCSCWSGQQLIVNIVGVGMGVMKLCSMIREMMRIRCGIDTWKMQKIILFARYYQLDFKWSYKAVKLMRCIFDWNLNKSAEHWMLCFGALIN